MAGPSTAQSLAELAKKEKERRKKVKAEGEETQVITEEELARAKSPTYSTTAAVPSTSSSSAASQSRTRPTRSPSTGASQAEMEGESDEAPSTPTEIPREGSLQEKLAVFQQMMVAHRNQVNQIDEEIAKNNTRIEEIQQQLITIGAGGLPVAPTAPQVDRATRYEGESVALQQEQQQLRQKNQQLEAQKKTLADELREKGRRAGIPAGYLRF